jgi:antitoxin YefM
MKSLCRLDYHFMKSHGLSRGLPLERLATLLTLRRTTCTVSLYNSDTQSTATSASEHKWARIKELRMGTATYSYLRENLAEVWDEVEDTQEPVIVKRRGHRDLALIPADELESLRETAQLLRSPRNARRLMEALTRAYEGQTETTDTASLRTELGLADNR